MKTWICSVYLYDELIMVLRPVYARQVRRDAWRSKLPPADVRAFYVRGPGCVRFAS